MYRQKLFYGHGRNKQAINDNYLIITSLMDIGKLRFRGACLLNQYMNGVYSKMVRKFLDYLDTRLQMEYNKNEIKWMNDYDYKDWLDINPKHLYSYYIIKKERAKLVYNRKK